MMENDLDPLNLMPKPTPNRPLLGLTILIVEDSRSIFVRSNAIYGAAQWGAITSRGQYSMSETSFAGVYAVCGYC